MASCSFETQTSDSMTPFPVKSEPGLRGDTAHLLSEHREQVWLQGDASWLFTGLKPLTVHSEEEDKDQVCTAAPRSGFTPVNFRAQRGFCFNSVTRRYLHILVILSSLTRKPKLSEGTASAGFGFHFSRWTLVVFENNLPFFDMKS